MKKVVLVSNTSWSLYNFRLKLILMLIENGIEVHCIANPDDYSVKLKEAGAHFLPSTVDNKGVNPFNDIHYTLFLLRAYRRIRPDFVFHYTAKPNIYGSYACHRLKIKSVAFVSGTGHPFLKKNLVNLIVKKLYTTAGQNCTEMWFLNAEDLNVFISEGIVDIKKTQVLPGEGIDVHFFSRSRPYPHAENAFIFLLSSRLMWDKGIGIYATAAKMLKSRYPSARFKLLGFIDNLSPSSIKKKQIDEWVSEGILEYLGGTSDVKKYLLDIHCFVMPSYYKEGIPKTLLEACSLEIPVVTTDNTGCREVITHNYNGLLCEPKNAESLAQSMEQMMGMDYEKLKVMGENGRKKIIAEFNDSIVLGYYRTILKEMLVSNTFAETI